MPAHWTIGSNYDVEFASEAEVKAVVERRGDDANVIKWVVGFDDKPRSCAMQKYRNGAWVGVNIHE